MGNGEIITLVTGLQIMAAGVIRVRLDRVLRMGGRDERLGHRHYQLMPGDDLDDQPREVQAFAAAHWNPEHLAGVAAARSLQSRPNWGVRGTP
jgi:hypothetical protein